MVTKTLRPSCLQIESTNACNLNCVMCPRQAMTRPIGFMSFSLFKKIIGETVPLDHIWLHHFGEALLHPKLADMVQYAKENETIREVGISTNATLLSPENGRELIDAGLDFLIISVDGRDDVYEKIRVGAKWSDVVKNIRDFLEEKLSGNPKTWIQIIDMPTVDVQETIKFWKRFSYIDKIYMKNFDTWAHQVEAINQIRSKRPVTPREPCPFLWDVMVVCWDGSCVPCCRDYDAKTKLGDAHKENMIDIFNGPSYRNFRERQMTGDFQNPLCKDCVEWAEAKEIETKYFER